MSSPPSRAVDREGRRAPPPRAACRRVLCRDPRARAARASAPRPSRTSGCPRARNTRRARGTSRGGIWRVLIRLLGAAVPLPERQQRIELLMRRGQTERARLTYAIRERNRVSHRSDLPPASLERLRPSLAPCASRSRATTPAGRGQVYLAGVEAAELAVSGDLHPAALTFARPCGAKGPAARLA